MTRFISLGFKTISMNRKITVSITILLRFSHIFAIANAITKSKNFKKCQKNYISLSRKA